MCKGFAGEAAVMVSSEDIQIHGGVGFTWECMAHWYYKRAKVNDVLAEGQTAFTQQFDRQVWGLHWTDAGVTAGTNDFAPAGIPVMSRIA